jgi:hypothetical protein
VWSACLALFVSRTCLWISYVGCMLKVLYRTIRAASVLMGSFWQGRSGIYTPSAMIHFIPYGDDIYIATVEYNNGY